MAVKKKRKNNDAIGYAVMGLGALALLAMLAVAMTRQGVGPLQSVGLSAKLEGDWQASFNDYYALFQMHEGTFQILAVRGDPAQERLVSRGTATLSGNMLTLTPEEGREVPESKDVPYTKLTFGTYTVELKRQGDDLLWRSGPDDPERPGNNPTHPLIRYSGSDEILWRLKE